ncbi:MAG: alpha/beta hydrolase [Desulfobacterales bacterium]|nr:alpha/beta hydrolase [Desulfobacterales bacterium]
MKKKEPENLWIDIDDVKIQYLLYESDGPTIIFMHATGFMPWIWHPIAAELSNSFRVIAPYFCDHRDSEPNDGGLSWLVLAKDFANFCKIVAKDELVYLVGHSMGGTVITLAESLYGHLAKKMILIEPIFLPEAFYKIKITVEQHPLASKSIKRKNFWNNREEAIDYLKSKSLFKSWTDEAIELYIQYGMKEADGGGLELSCSPKKEASLFMGGSHYDPWPELKKVKCPVLLVEGDISPNKAHIDLQKALNLFPNGAYTSIEEAGHLIPMEKPLELTKVILDFFYSDSLSYAK